MEDLYEELFGAVEDNNPVKKKSKAKTEAGKARAAAAGLEITE